MPQRNWRVQSKINEGLGRFTPAELLTEEWVQLTPVHQISSLGRLRRLVFNTAQGPEYEFLGTHPSKLLTIGAIWVSKSMNRLVYENFKGPVAAGLRVIHLDGDKDNYRLSNLKAVPSIEVPRKRRLPPLASHP